MELIGLLKEYGVNGVLLIGLYVSYKIVNSLLPHFCRRSKFEKMDEYTIKYININTYPEKSAVCNELIEAEYGKFVFGTNDLLRQRLIIFLLNAKLFTNKKEAISKTVFLKLDKKSKNILLNKKESIFIVGFFIAVCFLSPIAIYNIQDELSNILKENNGNYIFQYWFAFSIFLIYCSMFILAVLGVIIKVYQVHSVVRLLKKKRWSIKRIALRMNKN